MGGMNTGGKTGYNNGGTLPGDNTFSGEELNVGPGMFNINLPEGMGVPLPDTIYNPYPPTDMSTFPGANLPQVTAAGLNNLPMPTTAGVSMNPTSPKFPEWMQQQTHPLKTRLGKFSLPTNLVPEVGNPYPKELNQLDKLNPGPLTQNNLGFTKAPEVFPDMNTSPTGELQNFMKTDNNPAIKRLMEEFKGYNPYGERASKIGDATSVLGLLGNKPMYVNYEDIGDQEIRQQNTALQRLKGGEAAATQDALLQGKTAMQNVTGKSLQSRNANLRNIAQGTSKALSNIRGQFAGREAGLRTQIGQRRTGIQQANLQKRMAQDDINTREYDTALKENLRLMQNMRKMDIERQLAFNKFRKDQTLEKLLKTENFEWDGDTIKFITQATTKGRSTGGTYSGSPLGNKLLNQLLKNK